MFGFCLVAILRKQWVEHERLGFPLVTLPESLAETDREGFFTVRMLNRPLFWLGFVLGSATIY
ncbi:MAG: hypothetical protein CME26_10465 [Gemmatimonadetes bacterium]|nr:hypothetical protein [Gemmatimonadota bacterium]